MEFDLEIGKILFLFSKRQIAFGIENIKDITISQ